MSLLVKGRFWEGGPFTGLRATAYFSALKYQESSVFQTVFFGTPVHSDALWTWGFWTRKFGICCMLCPSLGISQYTLRTPESLIRKTGLFLLKPVFHKLMWFEHLYSKLHLLPSTWKWLTDHTLGNLFCAFRYFYSWYFNIRIKLQFFFFQCALWICSIFSLISLDLIINY